VAMTDIVLNMFIFFFISFSLLYTFSPNRLHKLGINIPKAKHTKSLESLEQVNIYIKKDGLLYLEKEALLADELVEELRALKQKNPDLKILLQADKLVPFKYVAKVLEIVSEFDFKNFNIAVEKETAASGK
jgi:biopolymer transport protein ExbD